MSPLEKEILRKKLGVIMENLKALRPIQEMTAEEYSRDLYKRKATERLLQELIEASVDINIHIIAQTGKMVPDTYYESFMKIAELGIISSALAEKLAPSTGLRNRLVHEYDVIENSFILKSVRMAEEYFAEYIKEIEHYLSQDV
jgi:uncharacterized protein YutE (UPF0331/DUF86 family)